jgi:fibronectin-binding autotransporter adhesin
MTPTALQLSFRFTINRPPLRLWRLVAAAFALLVLPAHEAKAQDWTGAVDSNWFNPANWSTDSVPTPSLPTQTTINVTNGPVISSGNASAESIGVGGTDPVPTLTIEGTATLTTIYNDTIASGLVTVTGSQAQWNSGWIGSLGSNGTGGLLITNGGTVTSGTGGNVIVGSLSTGYITVDGTGSLFSVAGSQSTAVGLVVGGYGSGCLTISNGGTVTDFMANVGGADSVSGIVNVTGANSTWINQSSLNIGNGNPAMLNISNGGQVSAGSAENILGTMNIVGTGSQWIDSGDFLELGTLNIGSGSQATIGGNFQASGGVVNVNNGGILQIEGNYTALACTLNLNSGGVLQIGGNNGINTASNSEGPNLCGLNFAGGTLQVVSADLTASTGANDGTLFTTAFIAGTTSVIDTNGFNATWVGNFTGAGALAKNGAGTLTLNGTSNYSGGTILNEGTLSFFNGSNLGTGPVTFNGGALQWAGANEADISSQGLIFNSGSAVLDTGINDIVLASPIGGNGAGGLTKIGSYALTLGAAETYTGATDVQTGSLHLTFYIAGAPQTNIINSTTELVLDGGELWLDGNAGATNSQSFADTDIATGASAIVLNQNGAASLNLNLGTLTRNPGATADFTFSTGGNINLPETLTGDVLTNADGVAYATVAGADWATLVSGAVAALGTYQTNSNAANWQSTDNVSLTTGASTINSNQTINTLRFTGNTTTGSLAIETGATLTLATGGLLVTGNGNFAVTGGTLTSGAAGPELVIIQNDTANPLAISSTIADGGSATALTMSGSGQLTLTGSNTYSGGTFINGLVSFGAGSLGSGTVTINGGTLQWAVNNHQDISSQSVVFAADGATLDTNGNTITLADSLGGGGSSNLTIIGNGTVVLDGNNTSPATGYSGATIISNATVQFSTLDNFGAGSLFFGNGTLQWAPGSTADISEKTVRSYNNGAIFDTNGNNVTLANPIGANFSGSLTKMGAGTLILANTELYSGATVVKGGTLQLGDGSTNGNVASNGITDNANLAFAPNLTGQTYSSPIQGSGNLIVSGPGTLVLNGNETYTGQTVIAGGTLQLGNSSGGQTFTGQFSGTGNLVINGQTVALENNESFTGTTTIVGGVLQLGNGAANGMMAGNIIVDHSANLTLSGNATAQTYSGVLSGGGQFNITGGNLTLLGANPFSGNTNLSGLSSTLLVVGNPLALQNSTLVFTRGNVSFGSLTTATLGGLAGSSNINLANTSTSAVALTVGNNNQNTTYTGNLTGAGSLIKAGGGTLTLSGNLAYAGGTTLEAGTLMVTGNTAALSGNMVDNANLTFNRTVATTFDGVISGTGAVTQAGSANLTLSGANTFTGNMNVSAGTLILAGTLALQNNTLNLTGGVLNFGSLTAATLGGLSGNRNLALANSAAAAIALTVGGNNQNVNYSGILSGAGSLVKNGAGNLTLSGANSYTGNTTVSSGTLVVSNNGTVSATGTGTVTVAAGATLTGRGEVAGETTINGTLLPSIGGIGSYDSLTFGQDVILGNSATVSLFINGPTMGSEYGAVNVTGNLTLGGTLKLTFLFLPPSGLTFNFFQVGGAISGSFANLSLPDLDSNLTWDTSQFAANGSITIAAINYTQWAALVNLSGNNALPAAAPFGGDTANVIRYAMNLDTSPTPDNLPVTALDDSSGSNFLTIQYRSRYNMTDYQLVPQSSPDLVTWTDVDAGNITQVEDGDLYTAQFEAGVPVPDSGTVFLRVVAEPVP